mmetsp:Transcript_9994/g.16800  ORF Transcript_9994/g.16800 Transcript_9994/m.16800 type:complete len:133 (+) Transcript_9994:632-1030(+)
MISSKQSLQWIVDAIIAGTKIPVVQPVAVSAMPGQGSTMDNSNTPQRLSITKRQSTLKIDTSSSPMLKKKTTLGQSPSRFNNYSPSPLKKKTFKDPQRSPLRKQKHLLNPLTAESLYSADDYAFEKRRKQLA